MPSGEDPRASPLSPLRAATRREASARRTERRSSGEGQSLAAVAYQLLSMRISLAGRRDLAGATGDEDTFDRTRADAALDFDRRQRLELPALSSMLVEHLLNLVARHLAADHALAELDHPVFVAVHHTRTIVCRVRLTSTGRNGRLPERFALCPYGTLRTRRGYLTVRTEPLPLSSADETRPQFLGHSPSPCWKRGVSQQGQREIGRCAGPDPVGVTGRIRCSNVGPEPCRARRGRTQARHGNAARDGCGRYEGEPGLPGGRQVLRLLQEPSTRRGRPGQRRALPRRHRVLGCRRGREAGAGPRRVDTVLLHEPLRWASVGAGAGQPLGRAVLGGAAGNRPGGLAREGVAAPSRAVAEQPSDRRYAVRRLRIQRSPGRSPPGIPAPGRCSCSRPNSLSRISPETLPESLTHT